MLEEQKMAAPDNTRLREAEAVDVLLLLEGTFPYVSGGVSSWVNQIMRGFPDLSFGAVFLGSRREDYGAMKYALPDNLKHLEIHYLHEHTNFDLQPTSLRGSKRAMKQVAEIHQGFREARYHDAVPLPGLMAGVMGMMHDKGPLSEKQFLHGKASWDYMTEQYAEHCTDPSFVDYFWTVRIMHAPIWKLLRLMPSLPQAKVLHTISTGYAGLFGAMIAQTTGRPLLLSEHGIYTKERRIDLFQSEWIRDNRGVFEKNAAELGYFRELWIRFFDALGRVCYQSSRHIVALYEANRQRQIHDGAPAEKTRSIPNGVDVVKFGQLRHAEPVTPKPVLCLIGRVVPIKDVKTFIRSMRTVVNRLPEAEAWIAGPEDEQPEYAQECKMIAASLGLEDKIKFLGFQQLTELLPKIGLVVLSSISEALPLVLLEGFAAGVPAVTTDVGSCRQLIYGHGSEDEALGAAGAVVRIADPAALGDACVNLLTDHDAWRAARAAGIARVERFYTQQLMFNRYRALYRQCIES